MIDCLLFFGKLFLAAGLLVFAACNAIRYRAMLPSDKRRR